MNIIKCNTDTGRMWSGGRANIVMQIKSSWYQKHSAYMYLNMIRDVNKITACDVHESARHLSLESIRLCVAVPAAHPTNKL